MPELIGSILEHATALRELVSEECPISMPSPVSYDLTGTMPRLTIDIPAELHLRFEAKCALHGTRMADDITALVRRIVVSTR